MLLRKKFKVFWNSSQSTTQFRKLWRRFCRLSKNHWRQVIREQSLYSRREANHNHLCNAKTAEHEARASTSTQYQDARVEAYILISLQSQVVEPEARDSTSPQSQDAEHEAHVWQSSKPASSKVRSWHLKCEAQSLLRLQRSSALWL